MLVKISPSEIRGKITVPPSKSYAHRGLICAALANGESKLTPIVQSADVLATARCLNALGADIRFDGDICTVCGTGVNFKSETVLDCGESGSTLRFLIPLSLAAGGKYTFKCSGRLPERPLDVYKKICTDKGILFEQKGGFITVDGKLESGIYEIAGDVSSQFVTGLILALSVLEGESKIVLTTELESKPYVDITLSVLEQFGADGIVLNEREILVPGKQKYISRDFTVEGDCSNAAFFYALNNLSGAVQVDGIKPDSIQGDRVAEQYLKLIADSTPTISLKDCPDLGPVLMAAAAANNGAVFTDCERLKIKESDRASVMAEELAKFSVNTEICGGRVTVSSGMKTPTAVLCSHNDHRIAMALAVLCTKYSGSISDAGAVKKSFPDFYVRLEQLGANISYEDE